MVTLRQVVSQVLCTGVLTQEDLFSINDLLRHSDSSEMDALDTLLDALMNRQVLSQTESTTR